MKKSIYVLMFVLGLGAFSNVVAYKTIFLKNTQKLQSFLAEDYQGKDLRVSLCFYDDVFLTAKNVFALGLVFANNIVTDLSIQLAKKEGEAVDLKSLQLLMPLLAQLQDLKDLNVYFGNAASTNLILQHLSGLNPELAYLHLKSSGLNDTEVAKLAQLLPRFKNLEVLGLSNNDITDASATALAPAFAQLSVLRCVMLYNNNIEDQAAFASAIASVPGNEGLELSFPEIYVNGALNKQEQWQELWQ